MGGGGDGLDDQALVARSARLYPLPAGTERATVATGRRCCPLPASTARARASTGARSLPAAGDPAPFPAPPASVLMLNWRMRENAPSVPQQGPGDPRSLELDRVRARARALAARRAQALALARVFARRLLDRGAVAVWLFGSVLHPARFTLQSDVDIAVEGLPPDLFLDAYREGMDSPVPVDVTDLATARAGIRAVILREGRSLGKRT